MATFPRVHHSKHGASVSSPFSSSPRKLREMTLPVPDGHDVTAISGISMKQYEEQLNGLRKENFNLKLRVYFLEEKLGNGSPPAVQGLLEHNVRLQVELEELRRQLTDKQELLAAAAEAIDMLGQQGSISTDSIDEPISAGLATKKEKIIEKRDQSGDETCGQESERAVETLESTTNNEEQVELFRLRRENRKALLMIKGCMKKIQQQEKEIKKATMEKQIPIHLNDSQVGKYEETLKCKDDYIKDLENKIKEMQNSIDTIAHRNDDSAGNLQELLTRRLQGLAYFLDKLLSHKCVLGEDKKKLAESLLEQSLALPVGLKLDESMAPEEFTMDESNLDISQSLKMADLTLMFGHHVACSDGARYLKKPGKESIHQSRLDAYSESECWSEPDRNVSMARMGLCEVTAGAKESTSESNKHRMRRSRGSYGPRLDDPKSANETILMEEVNILKKRIEHLEEIEKNLSIQIDNSQEQIVSLVSERDSLVTLLNLERVNVTDANKSIETVRQALRSAEVRAKELEDKFSNAAQVIERLRAEKQELEMTFAENERALRRAADEAAVQASQASLERARAQHDRLRVERELEETRLLLSSANETNSRLEVEVNQNLALNMGPRVGMPIQNRAHSDDDRPTSPDQGIDSDRLSSLEQIEGVPLSPRSLYEENVLLKEKLARTKATLADTLAQLNAANVRKRSVQLAICREIHKTHGVLRKARDQFENPN